jgi:two-component system chemotaxis sensor kinase CheA
VNSDPASGLSPELLDDFYAECDEQLTAIRQGLVTLEDSVGRVQADPAGLEKLFRSFHSFKGNSSIIGLRPAERLAHSAEDFLRELTDGKVSLTSEGLDLLMASAQRLEQIIAAHREKSPGPDITALLERLRRYVGKAAVTLPHATATTPRAGQSRPDTDAEIEEARANGLGIWRFTFTPTRVLDQRGINVNGIRARLAAAGKIIQATPQVHADGSIAFEFIAALSETPANLSAWEEDGVGITPFDVPPLGESAERQSSEPVQAAAESPLAQGPFVAPSHIVRVDLSRLDDLMRITGEMVIHRARLEDQINRLAARDRQVETRGLVEVNTAMGRALRELRESIIRVRLVPISEIFARMPFVVRDLSRETGKKVRLTLDGQKTEIDKYLVERLKDPLLHLVRNAMSHGIESADERIAAGKPAQATIFLRASTIGDTVLIEIGDDGRGIDVDTVRKRATDLGLTAPASLSDTGLLDLICVPGFSTRDEADRASGRGVGMAVVNSTVRELGGTLSLETQKGRGTKFGLRLPLTLAIADVFLISVQEQTCAIPQSFVQEVLQMNNAQVRRINDTEVIPFRDGILPLIRLRSMFRMDGSSKTALPVLVLSSDRGRIGLVVDRIHGQREVVVSSIRDPLVTVPGVAGATELGDGRPVLILDAGALTSGIVRPHDLEKPATPNGGPISLAI